jgi:hypothetical protein
LLTIGKPSALLRGRAWRYLPAIWGALSLAALPGCSSGPQLAAVSGQVTYGGKPVTEGAVLFQPVNGPLAVGKLDATGHYRLITKAYGEGAIVGKGVFTIVAPTDIATIGEGGPGIPPLRVFPNIPEKFRRPESSGLNREIKAGGNQFDFELKER